MNEEKMSNFMEKTKLLSESNKASLEIHSMKKKLEVKSKNVNGM